MRFVLMTEPQQGMSYADQLAVGQARRGERLRCLLPLGPLRELPGRGRPADHRRLDRPGRGLARETERIGLGVLVSPVTFRHPGVLAKVVTTVDEMSGGRIEVGVGAGWNEIEHRQLGLAFPPIKERADLLEDQLAILHGLWGEPDGWTLRRASAGVHVEEALFRPRPVEVAGRPTTPMRRRPAADHRRRPGVAAVVSASRPATPTSSTLVGVTGEGGRGGGASSTRRARRSGATRRRWPGPRWPGSSSVARRTRSRRANAPCSRRSARRARRRGGLARGTSLTLGLRHAGRGSRAAAALRRRPASSGSCSRTSCRGTST